MNKLHSLSIIRDRIIQSVTVADILHREGISTRGNRSRCPIHSGDNKSIFGYTRNTFHCFKCGERGNTVDLVMKIHKLDFESALKKINYDFGLALQFDREPGREEIEKWEKIKRQREIEKQRQLEEEKLKLDMIEARLNMWELGNEKGCEFVDDILDNQPELIKCMGIKPRKESDFR